MLSLAGQSRVLVHWDAFHCKICEYYKGDVGHKGTKNTKEQNRANVLKEPASVHIVARVENDWRHDEVEEKILVKFE